MKRLIIILAIIVIGCDSKKNVEFPKLNSDYAMHGLMIERYSNLMLSIQDEAHNTINDSNLSDIKNAEIYDSLTVAYRKYLDKVFDTIFENATTNSSMDYNQQLSNKSITNKLFFSDDNLSAFGEEYLNKQKEYHHSISQYVKNKNLIFRINKSLNSESVKDRNGTEIKYLDYHFRDMPPIAIMSYIKFIQYSITAFENEHFKNLVIGE